MYVSVLFIILMAVSMHDCVKVQFLNNSDSIAYEFILRCDWWWKNILKDTFAMHRRFNNCKIERFWLKIYNIFLFQTQIMGTR